MKQLFFIVFWLSCTFCINTTQTDWRVVYIKADSDNSQVDCPVQQCHSLLNVIRNQSYYFKSNTTLELLPGNHYITRKVGHLVIANVSNFKITGSSQVKGNVTISCQPDATLGFTFLLSHNVEISNIKISKCSAVINPKSGSGILDLALKADYKNLNKI